MIKSPKPAFEKIEPGFGSSFAYRTYDENHENNSHNFWHYHPELELVYVKGGMEMDNYFMNEKIKQENWTD